MLGGRQHLIISVLSRTYIEVTSAAWHLKWPEIWLFVQQHRFKKKSEFGTVSPLCVGSIDDRWIPLTKCQECESFSVSWHHNSTHLHVSPAHVDYVTVEDVSVLLVEIHPFFHQGFRDVTVIETVTTVTSGHASACKFIQNNSKKLNMEIVLSWPDANVSTKKCKYISRNFLRMSTPTDFYYLEFNLVSHSSISLSQSCAKASISSGICRLFLDYVINAVL